MTTRRLPLDTEDIVRISGPWDPAGKHYGEDLSCVVGTVVYAPCDGVLYVGWDPDGFGSYIAIETPDEWVYLAHLSAFAVPHGTRVVGGQWVGLSGNTGKSTGPHLHWEVRAKAGSPYYKGAIDPRGWLMAGATDTGGEGTMTTKKRGYHLGNVRGMTALDWQILEQDPPGIVVYLANEEIKRAEVARILGLNPACRIVPRPYYPPQRYTVEGVERYLEDCRRALREALEVAPAGQVFLKPFNEPNQPVEGPQWEGFGSTEGDMARYAEAFCRVADAVHAEFPGVGVLGFSLTDGNRDLYFPGDPERVGYYYHGPEGAQVAPSVQDTITARATCACRRVLEACDAISAHVYIHERPGQVARGEDPRENWCMPWYGKRYREIARWTSGTPVGKPIFLTEAGFPNVGCWPWWGDDALVDWAGMLEQDPLVAGYALWMLGDSPGWGPMWYPGGTVRPVVGRLAALGAGGVLPDLNARIATWGQGEILPLNPDAALARVADLLGMLPATDELRYRDEGGVVWVTQAFRRPDDARTVQHWVRTREGDWDPAHFVWWTWGNG